MTHLLRHPERPEGPLPEVLLNDTFLACVRAVGLENTQDLVDVF